MRNYRRYLKSAILAFVLISIVACPLSAASVGALVWPADNALALQTPFDFEPSIAPLELTALAETEFPDQVGTPGAITGSGYSQIVVEGNSIVIDGRAYPIGDVFSDASDIPLASVERSLLGDYGYATLLGRGGEGHRLTWITTKSGDREYMIVPEDSVFFSGNDRFQDQLQDLKTHETHMRNSVGALIGATGTVVAIDLGLCPATIGTACVKAAFTALIGGIGAFGASMWYLFHDVVPAQKDVIREFRNLDINLP